MPADPSTILSAAGSALPSNTDFMNLAASQLTNLGNQITSNKQYKRQRRDAIEFWHMQNAYNSPEEQMKRFSAAGLNPNLIYGRGESGNAGPISVPDVQPPQHRSPDIQGGGSERVMSNLLMQADLRIKNAQANNLQAQGDLIRQDILLRGTQNERSVFDLNYKRDTYDFQFDFDRERSRGAYIQNEVLINRDAREAAQNASSLLEASERMLSMQAERTVIPYRKREMSANTAKSYEQIRQMIKDGTIKDLDIELRSLGVAPNSPMMAQIIGRFLSSPDAINRAAEKARDYSKKNYKYLSPPVYFWEKLFSGQ